ncbi:FecR domain-containing protein [Devosia rhodophyticola]|uniref:FecR domain-containing protein n=1 Tax=Devosia rhodophyticola TaxID=3026423 RepID=A0ABY7YYH7_9HYPH|nr:FecR domain-containing protein [Devosia rhodophyticola]WDR05835.1 FecR domain-containing protein [Devosia rhodophyticola]
MKMQKLLLALILTASSLTAAHAAGEGTAVGVKPDARAEVQSASRTLVVGDDISVGDRLVTDRSGEVQLLFADQTRLVVGPQSSLLIETYLLRNSNTVDRLTVNALAGTFRFISGRSPKSAYQIKTPTAAIAVRGTKFDFIVTRGQTFVMLYEGALSVCTAGNNCVGLNNRCEVAEASGSGALLYEQDNPDRPPIAMSFRYAQVQSPLLRDFRVAGAQKCTKNETNTTPSSLSDSSGEVGGDKGTVVRQRSPNSP